MTDSLPIHAESSIVSDEYPVQYLEGLRLFNEEEFFDCHDILEELWSETTGPDRKFLQGLIQASIALFHFGNENFGGAKKLYLSARKNLDLFGDEFMGIDLASFLADFQRCFQELLDNTETYPTTVAIRDELVPKIRFASQEPIG
jgi:predicted metal-dependent hydrolase